MLKITIKNPHAAQFQLEYAMYMMLSSYFRKAECKSKKLEKQLYLYYADLPVAKQYELEERCLKLLDEKIAPRVATWLMCKDVEEMANTDCEVRISKFGNFHELIFCIPGGCNVIVTVYRQGKRIDYELS